MEMRIVKPSVELIVGSGNKHVARCARTCYATMSDENDDKIIAHLKAKNHMSMFRHDSVYFIVPIKGLLLSAAILQNPYITVRRDNENYYLSTNRQCDMENNLSDKWFSEYVVDVETMNQYEAARDCIRYSFKIITQISTSREFNRKSPNNIAEQSTRYCNYTRGQFEGAPAICQPHWFDLGMKEVAYYDWGNDSISLDSIDYDIHVVKFPVKLHKYNHLIFDKYFMSCGESCTNYIDAVKNGMLAEDARGMLPIDAATEVIYTYSVDEWRHILDLRYYGITGRPHPNAKIVAGMIREKLIDESYDFRDE